MNGKNCEIDHILRVIYLGIRKQILKALDCKEMENSKK
jgi:hypothetical protein